VLLVVIDTHYVSLIYFNIVFCCMLSEYSFPLT